MPIDYLAQRRAAEVLPERNIEDEIMGTRTGIKGRRASFLGQADQLIGGRGTAPRVGELDAELEKDLSSQKFALQRKKYDQAFQAAYNLAEDYGLDRQSAEAYARQIAEQTAGFEFQASESAKDREHSLKLNALQDDYARRGVALQEEFTPKADYGAALTRVLLGTGTMIGANYMLNRPKQATVQPTGYASTVPNTLRSRSKFSR